MTSGTTIRFITVFDRAALEIRILDVTGRPVRSFTQNSLPPGDHAITWDGRSDAGRRVPSGLYFYRFSTVGFSETKKLVVR